MMMSPYVYSMSITAVTFHTSLRLSVTSQIVPAPSSVKRRRNGNPNPTASQRCDTRRAHVWHWAVRRRTASDIAGDTAQLCVCARARVCV